MLFKMCGFFPVAMSDNGAGEQNEYDRASFKQLLKGVKKAFDEGFDIGILPEGQLNPRPEEGLSKTLYRCEKGALVVGLFERTPVAGSPAVGLQNLPLLTPPIDFFHRSGAYTLARMSKRQIIMMSLWNTHSFWHANPDIGLKVTSNVIRIKNFGRGKQFGSSDEFLNAFREIVGPFGFDGVGLSDAQIDKILNC